MLPPPSVISHLCKISNHPCFLLTVTSPFWSSFPRLHSVLAKSDCKCEYNGEQSCARTLNLECLSVFNSKFAVQETWMLSPTSKGVSFRDLIFYRISFSKRKEPTSGYVSNLAVLLSRLLNVTQFILTNSHLWVLFA